MRTSLKAAIAAMALAGAAAAATPAAAQQFGLGFGPNGGITFSYDSGGYCDDWGCPDNFWDLPVYYGSVFYAGQWYDGPVYFQEWRGTYEYWIHGAWRRDEWRGPRPGWWREGRYGPALGQDYYRNHNFRGRWNQDRGNDRGHNFAPPDNRGPNFGPRGDDRRNGFNNQPARGNPGFQGNPGGFGNQNNQSAPQNRPPQNAAPANNPAPNAFDPRRGKSQRFDRAAGAPAPAAAPAPAPAPATPPDNGGQRGRDRRGH